MADIFGVDRPTGAQGGVVRAERDRREFRDSDLTYRTKQAEFFDYLDAAESRKEARATSIAQNRSLRRRLPSDEERFIETAKTETEQTLADRSLVDTETLTRKKEEETKQQQQDNQLQREKNASTLIDMEHNINRQRAHQAMTDMQYDVVNRAYHLFDEGIQAGHKPEVLYASAYEMIMSASADQEATKQWLRDQGITDTPDEKSINAMAKLASWGVHDSATTRAEHLLEIEWDFKIKQQLAKASGEDPADLQYKPPTEGEITSLGFQMQGALEAFSGLQGAYDDDNNRYTGQKRVASETVGHWAAQAKMDQIQGARIAPAHLEQMAVDILKFGQQDMFEDGLMWGWSNGGDDFDGAAFKTQADAALSMMQNYIRGNPNFTPQTLDFAQEWKANKMRIMTSLRNSQKSATPTPDPKTNTSTNAADQTGSNAGSSTAAPAKQTPAQLAVEIDNLTKQIKGTRGSERRELVAERTRLTKLKKKTKDSKAVGNIISNTLGITYGNTGSKETDVEGL